MSFVNHFKIIYCIFFIYYSKIEIITLIMISTIIIFLKYGRSIFVAY